MTKSSGLVDSSLIDRLTPDIGISGRCQVRSSQVQSTFCQKLNFLQLANVPVKFIDLAFNMFSVAVVLV
jgi:hypothetical protein